MLLLAFAGVAAELIAADYELSGSRLPPLDVDRFLANPSRVNARSRRQHQDDLATECRRREQATDRDGVLPAPAQARRAEAAKRAMALRSAQAA